MKEERTHCLIIGSGPAGYTAAIYASRANMSPILYEGMQPGGQLTTTTDVENFPGFPQGITGPELMANMRGQAEKLGADLRPGRIVEVNFSVHPLELKADDGTLVKADSVIIATGATASYLGLPDEQKYAGLGVSACATCDGFFYRGRTVAVVGGGDTACEEALYLSNLAKHVYMIVRKPYLRASKAMQQRVFDKENITILFNTVTAGLYGEEFLEGAHLVEDIRSRRSPGIRPRHRRIFLSYRPQAQYRSIPRLCGDRRTRLHKATGCDFGHQCGGCICRRRRCRPLLPPGHFGRRHGVQGRPRRRTLCVSLIAKQMNNHTTHIKTIQT